MHAPFDERGLPADYPFKPEYEVAPRALADALAGLRPFPVVIDVRLPHERDFAAIQPSIHIPLHELEARRDEIEDALEDEPEAEVILYCHHGIRSLKGALTLRAHGFENTRSLAGGIELWSRAVDPATPRYLNAGVTCTPLPPA